MNRLPETRYARSGPFHIAYQVVGEGSFDLICVPGWISHVELNWQFPPLAQFLRRLASFSRLIIFDKRGTGLSDAVPSSQLPTLEQRMDDVRAVMDAAGSQRGALLGFSEGGPMNLLFSATYPDRTQALVLVSSYARMGWAPDNGFGVRPEQFDALVGRIEREWGKGVMLGSMAPSFSGDAAVRERWSQYQRMAASPGAAIALLQMTRDIDARAILPAIRVPALVVHREGDRFVPVQHGRYLAQHIPGAKYVELPGNDHLPWIGDAELVLGEIQRFLTGVPGETASDSTLATVMFIDVVGSTELAARKGDRQWRALLESFQTIVRQALTSFRGREIDTAGDGFFAAFDGPARAIHCACDITAAVHTLGIAVRSGLHTGECNSSGGKLSGLAVHIGARIAAMAAADEILVSNTVRDLVAGSGLKFEPRGPHVLKGIEGQRELFAVDQQGSRSS